MWRAFSLVASRDLALRFETSRQHLVAGFFPILKKRHLEVPRQSGLPHLASSARRLARKQNQEGALHAYFYR
jgi:hypothetical protein